MCVYDELLNFKINLKIAKSFKLATIFIFVWFVEILSIYANFWHVMCSEWRSHWSIKYDWSKKARWLKCCKEGEGRCHVRCTDGDAASEVAGWRVVVGEVIQLPLVALHGDLWPKSRHLHPITDQLVIWHLPKLWPFSKISNNYVVF